MTFEPIWEGIIACYLFLAGVGGAAFASSAYMRLRTPHQVHLIRYGRIIAPVTVIIGLCLLMLDATAGLHNPLRFVFLLTNFGSVMTWGVVFLSVFVIIAIIVAIFDLLGKGLKIPKWLDIFGGVMGICVCIYTGCLLGVARTFPLWNNALLPILFLVSALSTGMAAVLLCGALFSPKEFDAAGKFKKFHFFLPLIEMLLVASLLFITANNAEDAGWASVMNLVVGSYAPAFWLVFVIIGLVVPSIIECRVLFFSTEEYEESRAGHIISGTADVMLLIGGFMLRLLILLAAMPITIVQPWM